MAEEIDFENHHFWNFKYHVTLDDLESDIIVNDSSTLTNTTIWFVAALSLIVDVWTDVRTDIFTGFIRSSVRRWPKNEHWGSSMVICLEQGVNDLHMVQLMMLLPPHLLPH